MPKWIRLANASDCPPGSAREYVAGERIVAVFHTDEGYFALDGVCPHQGGPLGQGKITGCIVTCPWHGWQFDVRTGQHQASRSLVHPGFPVKIEEGSLFVDLGSSP
jgi:nitrite reductase (NADH) small subunit